MRRRGLYRLRHRRTTALGTLTEGANRAAEPVADTDFTYSIVYAKGASEAVWQNARATESF